MLSLTPRPNKNPFTEVTCSGTRCLGRDPRARTTEKDAETDLEGLRVPFGLERRLRVIVRVESYRWNQRVLANAADDDRVLVLERAR